MRIISNTFHSLHKRLLHDILIRRKTTYYRRVLAHFNLNVSVHVLQYVRQGSISSCTWRTLPAKLRCTRPPGGAMLGWPPCCCRKGQTWTPEMRMASARCCWPSGAGTRGTLQWTCGQGRRVGWARTELQRGRQFACGHTASPGGAGWVRVPASQSFAHPRLVPGHWP